jgi:p-cumate 2,3-dioxygenase beta subunit
MAAILCPRSTSPTAITAPRSSWSPTTAGTLASRVRQLLGGQTWAENPRSRTRWLVTNFRILDEGTDSVTATVNFAVWRFQHEATDVYVGRYVNVLVRAGVGLMFRERRVVLDLETLRPHGKLSFIL